jgi:hypothetical protein
MYTGFDCDVNRWANNYQPLLHDRPGVDSTPTGGYAFCTFGSAHNNVCQFVFCNSAVHSLNFTVDGVTLGYLANRMDKHTPDPSKY